MSSSSSGSDTDDERDYYDFLFAKAQKKASSEDYIGSEKILRQLIKKEKVNRCAYLQPGTDRHYNTTSLLVEVLRQQGKLTVGLELCETSIAEIEEVLGVDNVLGSMLKQERDDLNEAIRRSGENNTGVSAITEDDARVEAITQTESVAVTQVENAAIENLSTSSMPLRSQATETEALGGSPSERPYYETMAVEAPPHLRETMETMAPSEPNQAVNVTETVALERSSSISETTAVELKPPTLKVETMSLPDTPVAPKHTVEDEAPDANLLSPIGLENPVSRSQSIFRKKNESVNLAKKDPYNLSEYQGLVWPPYDEQNALSILLVGERGCGKTMLRRRLLRTYRPDDEYSPTLPEHSIHAGRLYDNNVYPSVKIMEVSDLGEYLNDAPDSSSGTSPKRRLDSEQMLRRLALTQTDVTCICFDTSDMRSLHNAETKWYPQIQRLHQSSGIKARPNHLMVVACRRDEGENQSDYLTSMGAMTARYMNAEYFEVPTANLNDNPGSIVELSKALGQLASQPPAEVKLRQATKVLFIGDWRCGVSYLVKSLNGIPWKPPVRDSDRDPIYEQFELTHRSSNGEYFRFDMWDLLGDDSYDRVRLVTYPGTKIICLCFDIGNPDSLDNVEHRWLPIFKHYLPGTPFIMVGLQKDRRTDEKTIKELSSWKAHPVTPEEGEEMARRIGAAKYVETSIYLGEGLFEVKEALVDVIKSLPPPKETPVRKSFTGSVRDIFKRRTASTDLRS